MMSPTPIPRARTLVEAYDEGSPRAVRWAAWCLLTAGGLVLLIVSPLSVRPVETAVASAGLCCGGALAALLARRAPRAGAAVAVAGWWLYALVLSSSSGHLISQTLHPMLLAALATWTALGRRSIVWAAAAATLTATVLLILDQNQVLPATEPESSAARWASFLVTVLAAAMLTRRLLRDSADVVTALRAELAARAQAEARFRAIFDHAFGFFGLLTTDGVLIEANRAALDFFGPRLAEVVGRPFWDTPWWTHSREEQARLRAAVASAARGEFIRYRTTHRTPDGVLRHVDFSLKPVVDETGRVALLIPEGRELTEAERKSASFDDLAMLSAATTGPEFFDTVARGLTLLCPAAHALIAEIDPDGPGILRTVAIARRGETIPNIRRSTPPPSEPGALPEFIHIPSNAAASPLCAALRDMNPEAYMAAALRDSSGRMIGLIALLHPEPLPDAAHSEQLLRSIAGRAGAELARARADRSLRESEARLAAVINNAPGVAVQWYDAVGRVILWNRASETMFGFTSQEALGRTLDQLIHTPEETAGFLALLGEIAETGRAVGPAEYAFRRKSGQKGSCLSTIFRIPGVHDEFAFVCMDVDVTELRRAEDALEKSRKLQAIGQLAAGVAHDFNNLLTVVNGECEMLLAGLAADGLSRAPAEAILRAGRGAALLTNQLLALGGRSPDAPTVLEVNGAVREMEPTLLRLLPRRVALELSLAAPQPRILIDPGRFQQVVLNLVVNARDATPADGVVTVSTAVRGGRVLLCVQDTGVGMTDEVASRIFEPFFTTKEPGKGAGLGLATVYAIVKQSGGEVRVESAAGRGALFTIDWPAASAAPPPQASADDPPHGRESVLLVDDEPPVRAFAAAALTALGYTVNQAENGERALELAAASRPDLLLTDVRMPGVNGPRLAEQLRLVHPDLPILFMSGQTHEDEPAPASGPMLRKPFTVSTLARRVRRALDAQQPVSNRSTNAS